MRIAFVLLVAATLAAPPVLFACSCAPPPPPKEALAKSDAVFIGKVVGVEKVDEHQVAVTFEVLTTWKGVDGKKVTLYTGSNGAICGVSFTDGSKYLVYAYKHKKTEFKKEMLMTNLCTRTTSLEAAKEDIKELGAGTDVK